MQPGKRANGCQSVVRRCVCRPLVVTPSVAYRSARAACAAAVPCLQPAPPAPPRAASVPTDLFGQWQPPMCRLLVDDHLHARRGHRDAARCHPPRRLREGCALGVHPHGPVCVAHGPACAYAIPLDAGLRVGVRPARVVVVRWASGVGALERVGCGDVESEHWTEEEGG